MSYKYEYTGEIERVFAGLGKVKKGDVVEVNAPITRTDFKPVTKKEAKKEDKKDK